MYRHSLVVLCCLCTIGLSSIGLAASDREREARWADEIGDAIMTGDGTYLKADGHEFLTIHTEAETDSPRGAVIVLHGIGVHPDWPDVVFPLRTRLPEAGWATLSVQLPILAADASGSEYAALLPEANGRLDAALTFLEDAGHRRIVVVAHSLGSLMATYWLHDLPHGSVIGLVGIGMSSERDADGRGVAEHLAGIRIPVLDLYGSDDLPQVLREAPNRAAGAAQAGGRFQQTVTPGANHFFHGLEDELVETVTAWIEAL